MKYQVISFSVVFLALVLVCNIPSSFGHGLGTETMPPVMIDGTEATLEVASTTSLDTGIRQIMISLFETEFGAVINDVSFEVELIKNEEVLFKNNFERDDGILIMNLVPSEDSQVQIINHETFASFFGLASDQFNLQGNVFEEGGLYKFNVKILTINNYGNVLPEPVQYDLGISIPETTYYEINDINFGKQELGVITYFDQISEFSYDQETRQVEFSFPFGWDQETIDQTSVIHEEVLIPKSFGDMLVSKFDVTLNGVELPESSINIDDFTGGKRTVHVVVSQSELQEIFSSNQFDTDSVVLKFQPNENSVPMSGVTENGQFKVNLWWEDEIKSNTNVKLSYDILDTFLMDSPISVPYELKLFFNDKEVLKKSSISTGSKTQSDSFEFFIPSDITGILIAKFENLGGNTLAHLEFPLLVDRITTAEPQYSIPKWVKNNAGWWADGQIDDRTFADGIEFLIKQGIIVVPATESGEQGTDAVIPDWVRNNAKWWSEGQIDDRTFANGIEFLINVGIIVV